MKKTLTIIIVLVVLAVLVIWLATRTSAPEPSLPAADTAEILGKDTTSAINEDLSSLDLGDLDAEFEQIDADLNQL